MIRTGTAALFIAALLASPAFAAPAYKITKSVPLGAPDSWDYVTYEPTEHRVYVAHGDEITVVDGKSGEVVGRVQGATKVNGVAAVPALGKGYTDSRDKKSAIVFDLKTLKVTKEIPADEDTDGVIYDAASGRVFVVNGDANDTTIIDAKTDTKVANLPLGGKPEYLVSDEAGHVYIALTDKKEVVRVDAKAAKVDARWSMPECEGAHGMTMDRAAHKLFASCANAKMAVIDADKGAVVAMLPIGKGTDGAAFDSKRKLAFSSNGEGTVSVIGEQGGKYVSLGEVTSKPFARTMAVDSETGRLFLVTADLDEINPKAENLRQRYQIRRGTVQLLFLDPQ